MTAATPQRQALLFRTRLFRFSNLKKLGPAVLVIIIAGLFALPATAQSIDWQTDVAEAMKTAKEEKRLVLLHFVADWCKPCKNLDTFVFNNPRVTRVFNATVIPVKIDADENEALVRKYGVLSVPFDVVLSATGRVVTRRKSPRDSEGYVAMANRLGKILDQVGVGDNPAAEQSLNELEKLMKVDQAGFKSNLDKLTPDGASHMMARPSSDSSNLKRFHDSRQKKPTTHSSTANRSKREPTKVVSNPFFNNSANAATPSVASVTPERDRLTPPTGTVNPPTNQPQPRLITTNQFYRPNTTQTDTKPLPEKTVRAVTPPTIRSSNPTNATNANGFSFASNDRRALQTNSRPLPSVKIESDFLPPEPPDFPARRPIKTVSTMVQKASGIQTPDASNNFIDSVDKVLPQQPFIQRQSDLATSQSKTVEPIERTINKQHQPASNSFHIPRVVIPPQKREVPPQMNHAPFDPTPADESPAASIPSPANPNASSGNSFSPNDNSFSPKDNPLAPSDNSFVANFASQSNSGNEVPLKKTELSVVGMKVEKPAQAALHVNPLDSKPMPSRPPEMTPAKKGNDYDMPEFQFPSKKRSTTDVETQKQLPIAAKVWSAQTIQHPPKSQPHATVPTTVTPTPAQVNLAQAQPVQGQPVQGQPIQVESAQVQPVHQQPVQIQPVQIQPKLAAKQTPLQTATTVPTTKTPSRNEPATVEGTLQSAAKPSVESTLGRFETPETAVGQLIVEQRTPRPFQRPEAPQSQAHVQSPKSMPVAVTKSKALLALERDQQNESDQSGTQNPVDLRTQRPSSKLTPVGVVELKSLDAATARFSPSVKPQVGTLANQQRRSPTSTGDVTQASAQSAVSHQRMDILSAEKSDYALKGKCPVTLMSVGKWIDGDKSIGCVHRDRVYLFVDEAAREKFRSNPDRFSPLLAGFDPVLFLETGKLVEGLEANGAFMGKAPNQRIVLFVSPDTRKQFQTSPKKYIDNVRDAMSRK